MDLPRPFLPCLAVVALVGCTGEAPAAGGAPEGPPAARVAIETVREGGIRAQWSFLGDVRALRHAELAAGAEGEVRRVRVRVGDRVKRGALLLEVDPVLAAARLEAAKASILAGSAEAKQASRDAKRLTGAGPDVFSVAEIERAGAEEERAIAERARLQAAAGEARAELGRHRVRAPFAGVVARRLVDPGDWVEPGVQVLELVDDREVEVLTSVPPEVGQHIARGDTAVLEHRGATVSAVVRGVVRALDNESRTVRLRLVPNERTTWLLPGAAIDVVLTIERSEDGALVVPRDALVYGVVGVSVVKVVDQKAVSVPVDVLARGTDSVLVAADGLAPGDSVVTRGNERLIPGQPVSPVPDS